MADDALPLPSPVSLTTTEIASAGGAHLLASPLRLKVLEGPAAGAVFVGGERVVMGSGMGVDLYLPDPTVSKFHCELALRGDQVEIRDLGSRNGVLVDGVAVLHGRLHPGAVITLGRTRLAFDLGEEPAKIAISAEERFGALVGRSACMRQVFARLARAAPNDSTVLFEGETGTGKELAAEALHAASARRAGPFVVVDCGALPPQLTESELFGHEKGAFTGAAAARTGAFELAAGGTIFLDEIGELPADLQPKLLRALERREIKRVGGARYVGADVRVIAATNRDLRGEVNGQRFRADLYYRLAVLEVRLPPLRERTEDIPMLVEHILGTLGAAEAPEAEILRRADLSRHPWPGNVRELRNYVERALAFRELGPLPAAAQPPGSDQPLRAARETAIRDFERRYLEALLERHEGNVSAAARAADVDRKYFYRLLWRHGLR